MKRLTIFEFWFLNFDLVGDMNALDLENRLIEFAVLVIGVVEDLPNTKAGNHIGNQLIRSGTSPAPNYGEARSAESKRDFVHKIKISLKELRETHIFLRIIERKQLGDPQRLLAAISECNELIAIFVSSTRTVTERWFKFSKSNIKNRQS